MLQYGDMCGNFKHNYELCYLDNATMLQYGDFGGNFKLILT
jgi:hypothetical protein